jgi:hypothetical protein
MLPRHTCAIGTRAENICSFRAFLILTQAGHWHAAVRACASLHERYEIAQDADYERLALMPSMTRNFISLVPIRCAGSPLAHASISSKNEIWSAKVADLVHHAASLTIGRGSPRRAARAHAERARGSVMTSSLLSGLQEGRSDTGCNSVHSSPTKERSAL